MKLTPTALALSLALACALGAAGAKYSQSFPEALAQSSEASRSTGYDHGFALAEGSDPMLLKVVDIASDKPLAKSSSGFAGHPSFADIIAASSPSVVQVRVEKRPDAETSPEDGDDGSLLDFLKRFGTPDATPENKADPKAKPAPKNPFDDEDLPLIPNPGKKDADKGKKDADPSTAPKIPFPKPPAKPPTASGVGSGFFIDKSGYVLTNAHVVEGAQKIVLRLSDHTEIPATLIGQDKRTDIALLKADGGNFTPLPIGNPDATRVGDWVIAIGSPFSLEFTATAGILSATKRALPSDDNYIPFLQTDAAVNPGNSGGPLINERGQAIGINSQIYSRSGGYMGISFAIPIDYAVKIAAKIRKSKNGTIEHGRIGAYVQELTPELAKAFGLGSKTGAIILSVEPGTASEKAGMKASDIVFAIDGKPLLGSNEMIRIIADSDPGEKLRFSIMRKGEPIQIEVVLGGAKAKEEPAADKSKAKDPEPKATPKKQSGSSEPLGLKARPLNDKEAKDAKVSKGLKILESSEPAKSAGIEAGDILISADGAAIGSLSDLNKVIEDAPAGKPLAILIKKDDATHYFAVTP